NSRLHLPAFDQRSNRLKMVFQGPNSLGRSRHGTPVLRHHKTASTKLRLSFGGRPALRSVARTASSLPHGRSSRWRRTIVHTDGTHRRRLGKCLQCAQQSPPTTERPGRLSLARPPLVSTCPCPCPCPCPILRYEDRP